MTARRTVPPPVYPSLPPEKAHPALRKQLAALKELEGRNYQEVDTTEQEWQHLTQSIIEKTFGNPSSNLDKFYRARSAGDHQIMVGFGGGYGIEHRSYSGKL